MDIYIYIVILINFLCIYMNMFIYTYKDRGSNRAKETERKRDTVKHTPDNASNMYVHIYIHIYNACTKFMYVITRISIYIYI